MWASVLGEELQEKGMEEMALVGKGKGKKDMLVESDSIRVTLVLGEWLMWVSVLGELLQEKEMVLVGTVKSKRMCRWSQKIEMG